MDSATHMPLVWRESGKVESARDAETQFEYIVVEEKGVSDLCTLYIEGMGMNLAEYEYETMEAAKAKAEMISKALCRCD